MARGGVRGSRRVGGVIVKYRTRCVYRLVHLYTAAYSHCRKTGLDMRADEKGAEVVA